MLVFRDGRREVSGPELARELAAALRRAAADSGGSSLPWSRAGVDALLRAGELECALADLGHPGAACVAHLTDRVARALVGSRGRAPTGKVLTPAAASSSAHGRAAGPAPAGAEPDAELERARVPARLTVSPPEGFAYYGLHPAAYAEMASRETVGEGGAAVVGIRTIGTTLSAVVCAALERRGLRAERTTVRPSGHPFERTTGFGEADLRWIAALRDGGARFLVVDEGPGLSGSSFVSVGEALLEAGVPAERIAFLCSHPVDAGALRAPQAVRRWSAFRYVYPAPAAGPACRPGLSGALVDLSGGAWRERAYADESGWPASWTSYERRKYLAPDGSVLYKFEGLGRYGEEARERAEELVANGFGPRPLEETQGFIGYRALGGRPLRAGDADESILGRVADYCAFRAGAFGLGSAAALPVAARGRSPSGAGRVPDWKGAAGLLPDPSLPEMLRRNVRGELGIELQTVPDLEGRRPVLVDGRMLPHEWVRTESGAVLKTDGVSHGDDHFLPGPADVAWDLAGAAVEWRLGRHAVEFLLDRYRARSGDDARARTPGFVLAYAAFRMGYCRMAAEALRGTSEEARLLAACRRYRAVVSRQLSRDWRTARP